jgi:hypothetical protein
MVLHDVADDAKLVKVAAPTLGTKWLLECDLHIIDVMAVPGGAKEGVSKTKNENVLDHFLAKVVIDAEELILLPVGLQRLLELTGAGEVLTERLLDLCGTRFSMAMDNSRRQT